MPYLYTCGIFVKEMRSIFMAKIIYVENCLLDSLQVANLYQSVGWSNYTIDMTKLIKGINNSSYVISAYDGETLVGLLRVISDENTIAYVQDILVDPNYQRKGIGKKLFSLFLNKYTHVRQIVLICDKEITTEHFYSSIGFKEASQFGLACYYFAKS